MSRSVDYQKTNFDVNLRESITYIGIPLVLVQDLRLGPPRGGVLGGGIFE
jgi:hypothetical protein